ncbi:MAG TPA: sigma-70 family RNA polymerase sigma factor [Gemmatimonadaceae bacterium]
MDDLENQLSQHHPAAFGWALACCKWNRAAAEDVLQTAYLKVLDGRARFAGRADFRAFLFGVIRRTANEERRHNAIRSLIPIGDHESPGAGAAGLDLMVQDERSQELIAALNALSARQREVLHLVFYQDLTIAAAADVLGMSVGSARVHYERGKANLRRLLDEERDDAKR